MAFGIFGTPGGLTAHACSTCARGRAACRPRCSLGSWLDLTFPLSACRLSGMYRRGFDGWTDPRIAHHRHGAARCDRQCWRRPCVPPSGTARREGARQDRSGDSAASERRKDAGRCVDEMCREVGAISVGVNGNDSSIWGDAGAVVNGAVSCRGACCWCEFTTVVRFALYCHAESPNCSPR